MKTTLGQFTIVCRRIGPKYDRHCNAMVYNGQDEKVFEGAAVMKPKKLVHMIKWAILSGLINPTPLEKPKYRITISEPVGLPIRNELDRQALIKFWNELPHVTPGTL